MLSTTTRCAWFLVSTLLWAGLAAGCETQQAYSACDLDKEVTSKNICSGEGSLATGKTTSCVVRSHPHCVDAICLSYFSRQSVCTRACLEDKDCALDGIAGTCWEFAGETSTKPAEKYCVPPDSHYETLASE